MAKIITAKSGHFIIGSALVILGPDNEVAYPATAKVQTFTSEAKATAAHKLQLPDQYLDSP